MVLFVIPNIKKYAFSKQKQKQKNQNIHETFSTKTTEHKRYRVPWKIGYLVPYQNAKSSAHLMNINSLLSFNSVGRQGWKKELVNSYAQE